MKCTNCGFELNENANFCSNCGSPVNRAEQAAEPEVMANAAETVSAEDTWEPMDEAHEPERAEEEPKTTYRPLDDDDDEDDWWWDLFFGDGD